MFAIFTRNFFLFLAIFIGTMPFLPSIVLASPSISGVSGTIANGQSVTVSGSGFGTKANAAPIKFDSFEEGTNGATLNSRDSSWSIYDQGDHRGALYQNAYAHSGALSVGRNIPNGEQFNTNYFTFSPATTEVFISYWWRTANASTADKTIAKMSRINSSAAAGGGGVYTGLGDTTLGGTFDFSNGSGPYCAYWNGATSEDFFGGGSVAYLASPPLNTWVRVDMYKKLSTAGSTDGAIFVNMLGVDSKSNMAAMTRASGKSFLLNTVLLGMEDGSDGNHNYDVYIDDVYIDKTQARVEICNTSTWAARTVCEIQPAAAWSASSIKFSVNQGAIPASSGRYLYVVDSSGNANNTGYAITFGGTSGTASISAPKNLRVN